MLQRILGMALGFATSGIVAAGTMGPVCAPGDVTVPCEANAWSLGVQALYLQPLNDSSRAYVVSSNTTYEKDAKWGWGYALDGAYHFGTGNDLAASWMHYDVTSQLGNYIGVTPVGVTGYSLSQKNMFDKVDLVLGQHVDFGLLKNARFYGGLQYANIRSSDSRSYQVPPVALGLGITGVSSHDNSKYYGVGPVIGIDYSYDLPHGLSMTATTAGSILAGTSRNSTGFAYAPTGLVPTSTYMHKKSIVPGLEAKLGLNYAHAMAQGVLNIFGGYQALNYFNALPVLTGTQNTDSDFGLYGPYFGLSWLGNA